MSTNLSNFTVDFEWKWNNIYKIDTTLTYLASNDDYSRISIQLMYVKCSAQYIYSNGRNGNIDVFLNYQHESETQVFSFIYSQ